MSELAAPQIQPGETVEVVDAVGVHHRMRALSDVEVEGHTFPVVWVTRPDEHDPIPWPATAVLTSTA